MVRVSGYGQTGPYSARPGFAAIAESLGGLRYLTGTPGQPPVRVGVSIGDSLASDSSQLATMPQIHYVVTARIFGARGGNVVNQAVVMIGA